MALSPRTSPSSSRSIWSWALYDFANSSFTTVVVTFVYSFFFTQEIASDELEGTTQWSLAVTISAVFVAIASPYLGAIADSGGYRKRFLLIATVISVGATAVLFFPQRGDVLFALTAFAVANAAFEMANVFYNAYLPDIAPPEKIGRVSGNGWALGYVGGLLCLVIGLVIAVWADPPPFGLDPSTGAPARATNLVVAVWFAVFSLPLFLVIPEIVGTRAEKTRNVVAEATRQIVTTFHEIRTYRQIFRLLVARLVYNDGLVTIFAFGSIYAGGTFGFSLEEIILFGIALNLSAGIGAFLFGYLDDRLGGRTTILVSLIGLSAASFVAVIAPTPGVLWFAGIFVGLLVGPNQSASRSLMGRFVPDDKENEFFGFFAFSGKATAFLGPLLLGQLTALFGSQRFGVATVIMFFVVGGLLVLRIDEKEGILVASRGGAKSKSW